MVLVGCTGTSTAWVLASARIRQNPSPVAWKAARWFCSLS